MRAWNTPTRRLELEEGDRGRGRDQRPRLTRTRLLSGGEKVEQLLDMQRCLLPRTCALENSQFHVTTILPPSLKAVGKHSGPSSCRAHPRAPERASSRASRCSPQGSPDRCWAGWCPPPSCRGPLPARDELRPGAVPGTVRTDHPNPLTAQPPGKLMRQKDSSARLGQTTLSPLPATQAQPRSQSPALPALGPSLAPRGRWGDLYGIAL